MKAFLLLIAALSIGPVSVAQTAQKANRRAADVAAHYRQLAKSSREPVATRASMDTITFPVAAGSAVSKAALTLPVVYLTDIPELLNIPRPPANSSEQTRAELDYLLRVQQSRKPEEIQGAKELAELFFIPLLTDATHPHYAYNDRALFFAGSGFGEWFNAKNLPQMARLLGRVQQDASRYYYQLKYATKRPRPYQLEPRLDPLEQAGSPSYPSSHAAAVYVNAYLLGELENQQTNELLTKAFIMAHSREVLGVDYPSDAEAARLWAREFVNYLLRNPAFQAEWKTVRDEWKQVRKQQKVS